MSIADSPLPDSACRLIRVAYSTKSKIIANSHEQTVFLLGHSESRIGITSVSTSTTVEAAFSLEEADNPIVGQFHSHGWITGALLSPARSEVPAKLDIANIRLLS